MLFYFNCFSHRLLFGTENESVQVQLGSVTIAFEAHGSLQVYCLEEETHNRIHVSVGVCEQQER